MLLKTSEASPDKRTAVPYTDSTLRHAAALALWPLAIPACITEPGSDIWTIALWATNNTDMGSLGRGAYYTAVNLYVGSSQLNLCSHFTLLGSKHE